MKRLRAFGERLRWLLAAIILGWFVVHPAHAGGSEPAKTGAEKYGDARIRAFALKVIDQLDANKVNVAIIARSGRPRAKMPSGINYTHVAFAVFEPLRSPDGEVFHSYAVYNVYQGADGRPDRSQLKQDVIYDFVTGIDEPDVVVCVPIEELQKRLLTTIRSPAYQALHTADYNLFANPWVDRYDNCVTHTLKICVAAIYETSDRTRIYDNVRAYFRPTPIRLSFIQSLGVHREKSIRHDDTPPSGFHTATYESLKAFLASNGLVKETFTVVID